MSEEPVVTALDQPSRRERYCMHNSLIALVQALRNQYITVEMRSGDAVCGKLFSVDGYMNVNLEDAVLVTADDKQHTFEHFFLQARNIKFITIPQHMDIAKALTEQLTQNRHRFCHQGKNVPGSSQLDPRKKAGSSRFGGKGKRIETLTKFSAASPSLEPSISSNPGPSTSTELKKEKTENPRPANTSPEIKHEETDSDS